MATRARSSSVSSVRSRSQDIISTIANRPVSRSNSRARSVERSNTIRRSRSFSRGASSNGPVARLNMYLSRSAANSVDQLHTATDAAPRVPRASGVRRWDGNCRTTTKWDSIRRDPELWMPNGDCLVHFYERGVSRRGPSLRVSLADIEASNCTQLLARYYSSGALSSPCSSPDPYSGADSPDYFDDPCPSAKHELYISAPSGLNREESLRYHLTTRNFFAWMYERPLVADQLGPALASLLERLNEYRPLSERNQDDVLAYIDEQGYTDFRDCPDHALAVLQFAEKFQHRELWTDAFVHCVGMNERLDSSGEFEQTPRASQALITRAHIEMQVRLERAGRSISNFLEDELSSTNLGLSKEAHSHLERFRSFLHTFYIGQHCYWPPAPASAESQALPGKVYQDLYCDFRNLHDYLVDSRSKHSLEDDVISDAVYRKISSYDRKHKYASLPNPLPLVPKVLVSTAPRKSFRFKIFGRKRSRLDRRIAAAGALALATNHKDPQVMESDLVNEYLRFEKSWTMKEQSNAISCAEGRKIRWILVYAMLQTLISVTKVPTEARDTDGVSYPLCCQTAGTPPWQTASKILAEPAKKVTAPKHSRALSLRETILQAKAKRDGSSVRPSPLVIPPRHSSTTPRRISIADRLSLRAPRPIRTKSWDILEQEFKNPANSTPAPPPAPTPSEIIEDRYLSGVETPTPAQYQSSPPSQSPASSDHSPATPTSPSSSGNSNWSHSPTTSDADDSGSSNTSVDDDDDRSNYGDADDSNDLARKTQIHVQIQDLEQDQAPQPLDAEAHHPVIPTKSARRMSFIGSATPSPAVTPAPVERTIPESADDDEYFPHEYMGVNRELDAYLSS